MAEPVEARLRTWRPLALDEWIAALEATIGRAICPGKHGPKSRAGKGNGN